MVPDGAFRTYMRAMAVIPARGGSKRIPGKNIKLFAGKPIIAYSIEAASVSGLFDRIIVSTDSEEIAAVARRYGGETPFMRPAELADDHAGTDAVFLHALEWIAERGAPPEHACCLCATAPLIDAADLRRGLDLLKSADATAAFSVAAYEHPIFRALRLNERGRLEMFWPEHRLTRSQDLPVAYHDAAQFYWANVARYRAVKRFFSSEAVPVVLPRHRVLDIDTPEDWEHAEVLFRAQRFA